MNRQGNPDVLAQARRRDSLDKRQRVLTTLAVLEQDGEKITHAAVARAARVSTWLTYTDGIREHIQAARHRQASTPPLAPTQGTPPTTPAGLRAELHLARQEIKELRKERDRLRDALRHQLGQQLDTLHAPDLTTRLEELTHHNHQLADQLQHATEENAVLRSHTASLEEDLAAARTGLRRMMRAENTTR
ncbi:DUF6262 family protein [Streptomyces phytohabitans]|uniref:DUF6262 family protein n=1 Tax=Streptomyces phytohabitans TaxID=1150371 RepID=UPI00345BABEF